MLVTEIELATLPLMDACRPKLLVYTLVEKVTLFPLVATTLAFHTLTMLVG